MPDGSNSVNDAAIDVLFPDGARKYNPAMTFDEHLLVFKIDTKSMPYSVRDLGNGVASHTTKRPTKHATRCAEMLSRLSLYLGIIVLLLSFGPADAHRDGCHTQHSCPSDHGTYICGDTGRCTQCPDNAYCINGQPCQHLQKSFTGKVVGLSDGDTFAILRGGKAVKVRLSRIDTPEKAQAFGSRAQQYASELVFQQVVTVQVKETDRYGRLVGEVRLADGRSVNQELVRAGMAWWYKQYAPHDTTLAQLEAEARAAQRGLWSDPQAVPPWEWRKR